MKSSRWRLVLMVVSVVSLFVTNLISGWRIFPVDWSGGHTFLGRPIFDWLRWSLLTLPPLVILGDTIHEVWGYGSSRLVTHCATTLFFIYGVIVFLIERDITNICISIASVTAAEVSDYCNDRMFVFIKRKRPDDMRLRHILSSAPAYALDSCVYLGAGFVLTCLVTAFHWGTVAPVFGGQRWAVFPVIALLRLVIEVLLYPLTHKIIKELKDGHK